jgi:hypothetical protein
MCNFASFTLTKDKVFWHCSESHTTIHEHHNLHADGCRGPNVLNVEITPPPRNPKAPLAEWIYRVDQDILPEWHDPIESERRSRAALSDRAELERWLVHEDVADGSHSISGYGSTLTGGDDSTLTGGDDSTLTGGDDSTLTGGYGSTLTGGDDSTLTGGYDSTLTGGYGSTLVVRWWDSGSDRYRIAVGQVGEDGIEPGKPYRWDPNGGKFVEVVK